MTSRILLLSGLALCGLAGCTQPGPYSTSSTPTPALSQPMSTAGQSTSTPALETGVTSSNGGGQRALGNLPAGGRPPVVQ